LSGMNIGSLLLFSLNTLF